MIQMIANLLAGIVKTIFHRPYKLLEVLDSDNSFKILSEIVPSSWRPSYTSWFM